MLIIIGAFLIIQGIPGGHEWYESTFIHLVWNNLVSTTLIPPEFHVGEHGHDYDAKIPQELVPILFLGLIIFPIIWYFTRKRKVVL
jgi:cytochrome c-type biogenesis protein